MEALWKLLEKPISCLFNLGNLLEEWVKENGFWYQLTLSLFSATIFFIAFNWLPNHIRLKKIRPIINQELYHLKNEIFFIYDTILRDNRHSPSNLQDLIVSGELKRKDLKIGVQNKCFSEHYLYDANVAQHLVPIGKFLKEAIYTCELKIDKILGLHEFSTPTELILLENIRSHLRTYRIELTPPEYRPVVSSCYYLEGSLYLLYSEFTRLQKLVYSIDPQNDQMAISKATYLLHTRKYEKCIKNSKKFSKEHPDWTEYYELLIAECYYKLGKIKKCKSILTKTYARISKNGSNLVSYRNYLKVYSRNAELRHAIEKNFSSANIAECLAVFNNEQAAFDNYIKRNIELSKYFASITTSVTAVAD